MSIRADGDGLALPSLNSTFSREEVSMDLTMCGLLVDRAEELARLYADHRDWTTVEEIWFQERRDGRSTKGSSRKVYRVLSSRFKTTGRELPAISRLPAIFDRCEKPRDKAQVLYFYLFEADPLVRYVLHQFVNRFIDHGVEGLDFEQELVAAFLADFQYSDGGTYDYAESTSRRWGEGFRSVMREIGVIESQQSLTGEVPTLGTVPLLVSAGYSWAKLGDDWLSNPRGWLYLFQPPEYRESLAERLARQKSWEASRVHGELRLQPAGEAYAWAEEEEETR